MNVSCPSCPAKYVLPDAKIRGRRLRMVCKRCGAPFVVDGTAEAETEQQAIHQDPATSPVWIVMVSDRDPTQMSGRHLVELFALGAVHSQTAVWRVGTDDERTPFEFPELAELLAERGFKPGATPASHRPLDDYSSGDEATVVAYPSLRSRFSEGGGSGAAHGRFDDDATVAVPRSTASSAPPRGAWAHEEFESLLDERTVTGDMRALAAHSGGQDDDDFELGVAQLPPELDGRGGAGSIFIAPNSGEEPAGARAAPRSNSARPQLPRSSVQPINPYSAPRDQAGPRGARAPVPAAGMPASAPPAQGRAAALASSSSREADARPSQRPPPGAATSPSDAFEPASRHPLLRSGEHRIPPPPAVVPPPPMSTAPSTPRPAGSRAPASRAGGAAEPASAAPPGDPSFAEDATKEPTSSRRAPPRTLPSDLDLDAELAAMGRKGRRGRGVLTGFTVLLLLAAAAVGGLYAYDRALLVTVVPDLPRWLPQLFPAAEAPAGPIAQDWAPSASASAISPPGPAPSADEGETMDESELYTIPADAGAFDRRVAVAALSEAAETVKHCFDSGTHITGGQVIVTFAGTGRVAKVELRKPLAGTTVGECVSESFARIRIAPFDGDPVPVAHQVTRR